MVVSKGSVQYIITKSLRKITTQTMTRIIQIAFFLCISVSAFGQNLERLDSLINSHHENGFNGNVIYARNDSIHYSGNFGVCTFEEGSPMNDSTIFELGSNAKQFTAVATIQLIENDLLHYDTKVEDILADFPYSGITIEHLLRHQSGLPRYMKLMKKKKVWDHSTHANNKDVLTAFKTHKPKLLFEPGTKFKYSNTGYVVLALIIEKVSEISFPEYLKQNIFDPAGMSHSAVVRRRYAPVQIENNTEGYVPNKKTEEYEIMNKNPKYWCSYLDGVMGDGAISSTSLDLLKWNSALKNNTLISPENTKKLFEPDSISTDYGLGFFIDTGDGEKNIYHGGTWAGYQTWTYYLPESNEFIAILCNNNYLKTRAILIDVLDNI